MSVAILVLVTHPVLGNTPSVDGLGYTLVPSNAPQLNVLDLGATRGDGVFETIGVTNGRARALSAHLARFSNSARMLDLPEVDLEVWTRSIQAAIAAQIPVVELYVKIVLTRGIEGEGSPTGWVYAGEVASLGGARTQGIRVIALDRGYPHDVAVRSPWLLQGAKTLSYAVNRAALREAARRGADDVIFLSSDGFLLEGPTSTLILRHGNRVRTPRVDLGILAGTTQESAFLFFAAQGLETSYEAMSANAVYTADSAWLVSSVRLAAPIRAFNGRNIQVDKDLTTQLNEYLLACPS